MTILAVALIAVGLLVTVAVFIRKPADHRRAHVTVAELQARLADETEPEGEHAADEAEPTASTAEPTVAETEPTTEPEPSAEPNPPTATEAREDKPEAG
ncbi:hypothetical protein ACFXNW_16270 [Nocardia sp. NPDC059180]|uniref:hypothetical protein n=1 Tax=Nocardia sp. NPDC059180 TaxID=3346761 RepID=UPI00368927B7